MLPRNTRLRFVSAKSPETIQKFCDSLGRRIQIYSLVWETKNQKWFLWFVPDDKGADIKSGHLKG
jgi:hypothetical protein